MPVLVLEDALKNKEFFPAAMNMGREMAAGSVANDGGRAGDLVANPVEHSPVNAGDRRGNTRASKPRGPQHASRNLR